MTRGLNVACITCGRPSLAGASRCLAHSGRNDGWARYAAKHPDRAAYYASAHWRERRGRHLLDNPDCVVCGQKATHVDHVLNIAGGGSLDGPLQSLCRDHHKQKTQHESKQGNKAAARRRKEGGSNVKPIR
jgi:5-methylcytosine-specific restriction endonuclease McrA